MPPLTKKADPAAKGSHYCQRPSGNERQYWVGVGGGVLISKVGPPNTVVRWTGVEVIQDSNGMRIHLGG
jgi:hypothetical protein